MTSLFTNYYKKYLRPFIPSHAISQKNNIILLKESRTLYPRIVKRIGYKPPVMGVINNEKN
jgi:hypothetical protein